MDNLTVAASQFIYHFDWKLEETVSLTLYKSSQINSSCLFNMHNKQSADIKTYGWGGSITQINISIITHHTNSNQNS